jgi:hypothetical protein
MRHGGEAEAARRAFAKLSAEQQSRVIAFLNSLVIFPPDDTASNLDPGNRNAFNFPQFGHGSIKAARTIQKPDRSGVVPRTPRAVNANFTAICGQRCESCSCRRVRLFLQEICH